MAEGLAEIKKKYTAPDAFGNQVELDTKITKELEAEGRDRELIRNISKMRKELGLTLKDVIEIDSTVAVANEKEFLKETNARKLNVKDKIQGDKKEITINKEKHYISIKK